MARKYGETDSPVGKKRGHNLHVSIPFYFPRGALLFSEQNDATWGKSTVGVLLNSRKSAESILKAFILWGHKSMMGKSMMSAQSVTPIVVVVFFSLRSMIGNYKIL